MISALTLVSGVPMGEFSYHRRWQNATSSTTDNVAFASQFLCGQNVSITAKIESVDPGGYGGLMIRETTAAGSKQVAIFSNQTNVLRHETRYTTNGPKQVNAFYKPAPFWLRLQRQGDWVFAYYSYNGASFSYVHGVFVPMNNCVEVGLASFTYNPGQQTTAVFSNVTVTGTPAPNAEVPGITEASQAKFQQGINLYPNPTRDIVNLTFEDGLSNDAIITLRNQLGQVVEQRELRAGDFTTEWNVSTLADGLYLFEIRQDGEAVQVLRLVKTQ
jgi:regulation of enolase protein 1 (concanavalin A-like superfamily)